MSYPSGDANVNFAAKSTLVIFVTIF